MRSWTALAGARVARCRSAMRLRRCARTVIVVDASVLAIALADDGPEGDQARARLRGERLAAPELVDLEVASVWRRQIQAGAINSRRARLR